MAAPAPAVSVSALRPPSGPGALASYAVECSACPGLDLSASIESLAGQWAREHERFHAAKSRAKAA